MSFTPVTLTLGYGNADGTTPTGTVTFTPTAAMANGGTIAPIEPKTVSLVGGAATVVLNANDDTGTAPAGSGYAVVESIVGAPQRTYQITLSKNQTAVNLAALAPAVTSPLYSYVLASVVGAPNGVASLGSDGKVPAAQLPASQGGSAVSSVAGRTGAVVLSTADVSGLGSAATHPASDFASGTDPRITSPINPKLAALPRRGIALSGAEFTPASLPGVYGTDYAYPGAADFTFVASRGYDHVRLPFRWERIQPVLSSPLDPNELARLTAAVALATTAGLRVVLDLHNYGQYQSKFLGDTGTAGAPMRADFVDLWQRMSSAFASNLTVVGYGLMNEPGGLPTIGAEAGRDRWFTYAQAAVTAIRALGDITPVMVAGYSSASLGGWKSQSGGIPFTTPPVVDPINNLYWEAHHYWDQSGTYSQTYAQYTTANASFGGTDPTARRAIQELQAWVRWLEQNEQRGYIGEFGWPNNADQASWNQLASRWFSQVDRAGDRVWTSAWSTGSRWSAGYSLQVYGQDGTGQITTPNSQATILEAHLSGKVYESRARVTPPAVTRPRDVSTSWRGWACNPLEIQNSSALVAGSTYATMLTVDEDGPVNSIVVAIQTAAVTPTAGQCLAALYDANGVLLGSTGDIGSQLTATGMRTLTLTADTPFLKAGTPIYAVLLFNGTTGPTIGRRSNVSAVLSSMTKAAGIAGTAQTALPASLSPGTFTAPTFAPWVGVSYVEP